MGVARATAGVVGELMMTLGALVLLFAVWQFWWTDVVADAASEDRVAALQESFASGAEISGGTTQGGDGAQGGSGGDPDERPQQDESIGDSPGPADPDDTTTDTTWAQGEDLALVHLPTVGELRPVAQGVDLSILNLGVLGHYPSSDLPGEVGNFAVAGHRTTYGAPLWSIGELQPGDPVVVETQEGWFVYALDRTQVIAPTQTEVIAGVPGDPAAEPTEAWMVLTACHPKFSAAQRIAAFALLDRFVPRADGAPPEVGA